MGSCPFKRNKEKEKERRIKLLACID